MKKIAILGCENSHANNFLKFIKTKEEFKDIEVIGVYSDDLPAAEKLREKFGDRAILRALHFIAENDRVKKATEALKIGDTSAFFDNVKASGESSFMWLQNIYTTKNVHEQGLSLALAVMGETLGKCSERSAYRVHGGGFAGTVQAFVPLTFVPEFTAAMDAVFGEGSCRALRVRADGALKVI